MSSDPVLDVEAKCIAAAQRCLICNADIGKTDIPALHKIWAFSPARKPFRANKSRAL